ncbi:hypothetical protein LSAT2_016075 [Lamellibrachia satsuma]|nr:hypothetical protein LSAT2_016075 [Lamellibrachia satsuma]
MTHFYTKVMAVQDRTSSAEKGHSPVAMGSEYCGHDKSGDRKQTGGLGTSLSKDDDSEDSARPGYGETSTVMTGHLPLATGSK